MIQENEHQSETNYYHLDNQNHWCHLFHFEEKYWTCYSNFGYMVMNLYYMLKASLIHWEWCTISIDFSDFIIPEFWFSIHYYNWLSYANTKSFYCLLVLVNCKLGFHFHPDDIPKVLVLHDQHVGCDAVVDVTLTTHANVVEAAHDANHLAQTPLLDHRHLRCSLDSALIEFVFRLCFFLCELRFMLLLNLGQFAL